MTYNIVYIVNFGCQLFWSCRLGSGLALLLLRQKINLSSSQINTLIERALTPNKREFEPAVSRFIVIAFISTDEELIN